MAQVHPFGTVWIAGRLRSEQRAPLGSAPPPNGLWFYPRFDLVIKFSDNILAGGFLNSLKSGRGIDFKHFWSVFGAQQVYAGLAKPEGAGRAQGGFAFFLGDAHNLGRSAPMQVGAEIAVCTSAFHRGDNLAGNHQTADVFACGLFYSSSFTISGAVPTSPIRFDVSLGEAAKAVVGMPMRLEAST